MVNLNGSILQNCSHIITSTITIVQGFLQLFWGSVGHLCFLFQSTHACPLFSLYVCMYILLVI